MIGIFPKNEVFFDLFEDAARNMHRAAELMLEGCKAGPRRPEFAEKIREVEHKGDKTTRQLLKMLVRSFITPLDREDIHALASSIDDVVDYIDDASSSYLTLRAEEPLPEYVKQAELIVRATELLSEATGYIRSTKTRPKCLALVGKVYDIESEGDSVHKAALGKLFSEKNDAVHILKWKELLDYMEEGLDACQTVANTIEIILLKAH